MALRRASLPAHLPPIALHPQVASSPVSWMSVPSVFSTLAACALRQVVLPAEDSSVSVPQPIVPAFSPSGSLIAFLFQCGREPLPLRPVLSVD